MSAVEIVPFAPTPPTRRGVTAAELQHKVFPAIRWIVDGYIAEGLTVLAGKPKLGKSWFALDIALAVALGGVALGTRQCATGDVLYAALEDTERRLQGRIAKVQGADTWSSWPTSLTFWTYGVMERLDSGGLDQLRAWIDEHPDARLVILDTLAKVRSGAQRGETSYEADYREVGSLKSLADETGVAVVVITHTRKMDADDPFDAVSGTLGITGAADTTLILTRDGQGTVLRATGRDVAEQEAAVEFDQFRWRELGEAVNVRRSDQRGAILGALGEPGGAMNPAEIADEIGEKPTNVRQLLGKMVRAGEVQKVSRGRYSLPSSNPDHTDHTDHKLSPVQTAGVIDVMNVTGLTYANRRGG